jgi:hypothetical protein
MRKYWCFVLSREHIKRGEAGGFCQASYGRHAPLKRMMKGDGVVFYASVKTFLGGQKCQRFTALGRVVGDESYRFEMESGFLPFRKEVQYYTCLETSIEELIGTLDLTRCKAHWQDAFHLSHFAISEKDFLLIAQKMLRDHPPVIKNSPIDCRITNRHAGAMRQSCH